MKNRVNVLKYIKNFDNRAMYCPVCLSKLESSGRFQYEDCCGSIINSTKWICPSKGYINRKSGKFEQCLAHKFKLFWNNDDYRK